MKLLKFIPQGNIAVGELDDKTQVRISAKTEQEALAALTEYQARVDAAAAEQAAIDAQKKAEKEAEKESATLKQLQTKAEKSWPDVEAYLNAVKYATNCVLYDQIVKALKKMDGHGKPGGVISTDDSIDKVK